MSERQFPAEVVDQLCELWWRCEVGQTKTWSEFVASEVLFDIMIVHEMRAKAQIALEFCERYFA